MLLLSITSGSNVSSCVTTTSLTHAADLCPSLATTVARLDEQGGTLLLHTITNGSNVISLTHAADLCPSLAATVTRLDEQGSTLLLHTVTNGSNVASRATTIQAHADDLRPSLATTVA